MCRFVEKKEKSIVFSTLSNPPYYSNSPIINNYYNFSFIEVNYVHVMAGCLKGNCRAKPIA